MDFFFGKTISGLASDPLFLTVIAFCTLILLYFPNYFLFLVFSPILISTSFLLLSILRLGAIQRSTQPPPTPVKESNTDNGEYCDKPVLLSESQTSDELIIPKNYNLELNNSVQQLSITHHNNHLVIDDDDSEWICSSISKCDSVGQTKSFYSDSFVEWDLRAPLEVIYEEYEGEEEEEEEEEEEAKREVEMAIIERYASLSKFYPETDSDISSSEEVKDDDLLTIRDWDSPEHVYFQWEGDEKEGMIEIELRQTKKYDEDEEENLIEIELYPASFPAAGK